MNSALLALCVLSPAASDTFQQTTLDSGSLGVGVAAQTTADLNSDGLADWVVASNAGRIVWHANPSLDVMLVRDDAGRMIGDLTSADVDGDGDEDLLVADAGNGTLSWLENPSWTEHPIAQQAVREIAAADLDGDGSTELVVLTENAGNRPSLLFAWRQAAGGNWLAARIGSTRGSGLSLSDVDSDGLTDVLAGARWFIHPGTLGRPWPARLIGSGPDEAFRSAAGDLNGDGRTDIALLANDCGSNQTLRWFEAPLDPRRGTWRARSVRRGADCGRDVQLGDVNADGALDLISIGVDASGAEVVRIDTGDGAGIFTQRSTFGIEADDALLLVDLEGDSDTDLLLTRSSISVRRVWTNGTIHLSDQLVAYWPFDESNGATAIDATGNGHDGVIQGAVWAQGVFGGALNFDGASSVEVADAPELRITDDITIAAWIFKRALNDGNRWDAVLAKASSNNWDYELLTSMAKTDEPAFYSDGTSPHEVYADTPLPERTWQHVAVTRSGDTVTFYTNGVVMNVVTLAGSFPTSDRPLVIGHDFLMGMIGRLDEVRLYDRGLSQLEVLQLMQKPLRPNRNVSEHP